MDKIFYILCILVSISLSTYYLSYKLNTMINLCMLKDNSEKLSTTSIVKACMAVVVVFIAVYVTTAISIYSLLGSIDYIIFYMVYCSMLCVVLILSKGGNNNEKV